MKTSQFNRKGTPFSFTFVFTDEEGNQQQELIQARLKQHTFRESAKRASENRDVAEAAAKAAADNPEQALSYICDYLDWWDIDDDDRPGEKLAIDIETLALLPDIFLAQLVAAMTDAYSKANPKMPLELNSELGSEPTAKLASQARR